MIGVAIQGGSGYGAGELLRLLRFHPKVWVVSALSETHAGRPVSDVHTHLSGLYDLKFSASLEEGNFSSFSQKVLFLALPSPASATMLEKFAKRSDFREWVVIDLSGALRLRDLAQHTAAYPEVSQLPELRREFHYAFPEMDRESIRTANLLSNPGCLATASILSLLPLRDLLDDANLVIDAKTGSSGAGRELKQTTHHPFRHANYFAYKPFGHQHEPEIKQALGLTKPISFLAQSLPLVRGIFVSTHLTLNRNLSFEELEQRFQRYYANEPFIRFRRESPQIADVVGTNFCDISFAVDGSRVLVLATIDNLVKGMAGSAIQSMNIRCGSEETAGLLHAAARPF